MMIHILILDDLVDAFTLRNFKNEPTLKHKRIKKNKGVSEDTEDDEDCQVTALVGYTIKIKGRSYNCCDSGQKSKIVQN